MINEEPDTVCSTEYQTTLHCIEYDTDQVDDIFAKLKELNEVSEEIKYTNSYVESTDVLYINVLIPNELEGVLYLHLPEFRWYKLPEIMRVLDRDITRFYKTKES